MSIPRGPKRLQEAFQEASKMLSDGFRVEDAIRIAFGTHFGLQKESLGLQKSRKSCVLCMSFVMLPFLA